jgi:single-strand DNA-binding protein
LKKGRSVYIEGRLETRKWTDKQNIERYTTQIVSDQLQMLGNKSSGNADTSNSDTQSKASADSGNSGEFNDMEDDIPF